MLAARFQSLSLRGSHSILVNRLFKCSSTSVLKGPAVQRTLTSKSGDGENKSSEGVSTEHEEWVSFQKKIAIEGFETGQDLVTRSVKKQRGGKKIRRRKERERARKALASEGFDDLEGGEFPPEVWSDEETAAFLEEAYGNLPKRDGKRGTNNLRRQRLRWKKKRMYDAKKKYERILEHERRMATRSAVSAACKSIRDTAEDVRTSEKEYQEKMYKQWAKNMVNGQNL